MNHSALLQSSFPLDGPITSDGDYSGGQRSFPGPTGFSMDDEDNHRRSTGVGSHLAQTVPIPATNGLRYSTQQSAMPDLQYGTSPTLQIMSPSDSCSDSFSSAAGSLYTHSSGMSYDRVPDFRSHRVPTLQPPTGISSTVQPPGNASLLGRNENFPGAYNSVPRGQFPSLTSLSDITRASQYTTTPRGLECGIDRAPNLMFTQPGSMYLDQRVAAPTVDAPPFHPTNPLYSVYTGGGSTRPEIGAKIHKGFFQVDDKWTCYRRNYFSISCSFSFDQAVHDAYLKYEGRNERIQRFSMSISAIVNMQHNEVRELVQHTPKRDKQSERPPQRIVLQPSPSTGMVPNLGSTATTGQHGFPLLSQPAGMGIEYNNTYGGAPQQPQPPTQHTFERIQFQKATANNGKRRAQQQYYNLVVDLYAEINVNGGLGGTEWVKIARKLSYPMVVRGRSPGHYKDGRRDSSTSMGPDGGSGGAGDGGGGAVLPPGLAHPSRSHIALLPYDSSRGHGYGRADYHQMTTADHSPISASPHISSSSSSTFDIVMSDSLDPMDSMKSSSSIESYPDSSYVMVDSRKDGRFRSHLPPPFEYDTGHKASENPDTSFSEAYDPIASMMSNDPGDHFLKHPSRMPPHSQPYHHSSGGGYDTIYAPRSGNGGGTGNVNSPYYRLPSSHSLCT